MFRLYSRNISTFFSRSFDFILVVSTLFSKYYDFNLVILEIFFFYVALKHRRIIQSITSSEMCSLHLTHSSAHTLGAVGTVHSAVDAQEMLQHGHRM